MRPAGTASDLYVRWPHYVQDAPDMAEHAPETDESPFQAASLLSLRLAREQLTKEKVMHLLTTTLQDPEVALVIGQAAGIPAAFHYGVSSREHGRAMRQILPVLYSSALPMIYVCGGASIFRGVLDTVNRFNTYDLTWEAMPPMPTARRLCSATSANGKLYVFGGESEEPPLWYSDTTWRQYKQLKVGERFDPFRGVWETIPEMPTARAGCAAASAGGLIYVCGGRIGEAVLSIVERYDTGTSRWERLPDMPSARSGLSAVALFGMLYVLGGKGSESHILTTMERFDPGIGWWQRLPPMTVPRSAGACGTSQGKIYIGGGFNGVEGIASVEAFDPATGIWEDLEPMLTWRIGAAAALAGNKLYIMGGKTGGDHSALMCECLDPDTGTWTSMPPIPERHVYCASAPVIGFL